MTPPPAMRAGPGMPPHVPRHRTAVVLAGVLLAGACATPLPDAGFGRVAELTRERTGHAPQWQRRADDAASVARRVDELLQQPLSAEGAVELALINNRALQAAFAGLGIADAERVRAGRLPNPVLGFTHLRAGGAVEIERSVMFNVLQLLTLPQAARAQRHRFEHAQLTAAWEAAGVAAQAREAYFHAIAAQDLVRYQRQVQEAAEAASELARRMALAGNFSRLAQLQEHAFYADATTQLARAQHQAVAAHERLVRVLGLAGEAGRLRLPERLPDLPAQPLEPRDAEQTALRLRLDVQMARRAADATASALGLARVTRFVDVLELGAITGSSGGEPRHDGYELELHLPLFDFGSARTAGAEAAYMQALHRVADAALQARSQVRESYSAYRTAYDLARHYRDEVVPLRRRISEENLLRYNGMLIGVFELLADARAQVAGVTGYIEALRDFWIADTQLQSALTARAPDGAAPPPPATAAPAAAGTGH